MRVFISGISGTGMGPLALMATEAGIEVFGTDLKAGDIYPELVKAGIELKVGETAQDGNFLQEKLKDGIDWFIHTSALPKDHLELALAKKAEIKCTKRDDFTAYLIKKLKLNLVAIAGTHGKTTTTAMIIWAMQQLGISVSYIVGSILSFAPSGSYHFGDQFFIYEADEYDRNFLKFHPWLAVVPTISYDHPDIYPTEHAYLDAFREFLRQSRKSILGTTISSAQRSALADATNSAQRPTPDASINPDQRSTSSTTANLTQQSAPGAAINPPQKLTATGPAPKTPSDAAAGPTRIDADAFTLAGSTRRLDASLAAAAVQEMYPEILPEEIIHALNDFPGVGRRFERLQEGFYTDYAHHPEEIEAVLGTAFEEAERKKFSGVVVVYEPHQNLRQHAIRSGYDSAFIGVDRVFWLPTFLTRENSELPILRPEELIAEMDNAEVAEPAKMDDTLFGKLLETRKSGELVLLLSAGPADRWLREKLSGLVGKA